MNTIKNIVVPRSNDGIIFTLCRPLGDEDFMLKGELSKDKKEILSLKSGSVIAKGEWLSIDEYAQRSEIIALYNNALKGEITYE